GRRSRRRGAGGLSRGAHAAARAGRRPAGHGLGGPRGAGGRTAPGRRWPGPSVTEGEDKPEKYPTAYRWADLVVLTKVDLAAAWAFDEQAFLDSVTGVRPGVEVVSTSARTGQGVDGLLERLLDHLIAPPSGLPAPPAPPVVPAPTPPPRRN
ncbi:MAG TPA: hypothetical protein VES93_01820, partial [Ornithinibacter sp.]|nr:hypothetical protein [Ornithinibacter sp.]